MTAVPTDARFTAAQLAALERIEAAPDAEESLRERVADVLEPFCPYIRGLLRREYAREMADAALAVIAGTR
jgi:hypothetical protein